MKRLLVMAILLTASVWGRTRETGLVVIARISNIQPSEYLMVANAKPLVVRLLAKAGVRLVWDGRDATAQTVAIRMDDTVPRGVPRQAMAYALPFATGTTPRIHILRNRLMNPPWISAGTFLGYVIAHEIAHVLEGNDHHSDGGLMEAKWGPAEYRAMQHQQLEFGPDDVDQNSARPDSTSGSR
jgi:hypothetical protein